MRSKDFIPRKDIEFHTWIVNFLACLFESLERFGFPRVKYDELEVQRERFVAAFETAGMPSTRTKAAVQEKNDARAALQDNVRQAIKEHLTFNSSVTDGDRDNLGLPVHKKTRTPSRVASTYPKLAVDSGTLRRLIIHFRDQGSLSRAKPPGQHGVSIRWAISDTPVVNLDDLVNIEFDTRSPFTLVFDGNRRGKTVYLCSCWVNTRGERGPWSDLTSAVIP
jgi:hypothetical protein